MSYQRGIRIMRMKDVVEATGLSRSTIYSKVSCNQFPKQIRLGTRCVGWLWDEVHGWLNDQIAISRPGQEF